MPHRNILPNKSSATGGGVGEDLSKEHHTANESAMSSTAFWISISDSLSSAEVASSRIKISTLLKFLYLVKLLMFNFQSLIFPLANLGELWKNWPKKKKS